MSFSLRRMVAVAIAALLLLISTACNRSTHRPSEQPIDSQILNTNTTPRAPVTIAPPTPAEIQELIARVLGGNVTLAQGRHSSVLSGDFNGDYYPDLMVAVKPLPNKLEEINSQVANWSVQNPRHSYIPPKNKEVVVLPPIQKPERVRAGETLLLVVHGYGPAGWRDPLATQTYLLRQAAGRSLQIAKPSSALTKDFGEFPSVRDVIAENLNGTRGVLYWTGAAYAWHVER
jgi:hypothetical protein